MAVYTSSRARAIGQTRAPDSGALESKTAGDMGIAGRALDIKSPPPTPGAEARLFLLVEGFACVSGLCWRFACAAIRLSRRGSASRSSAPTERTTAAPG